VTEPLLELRELSIAFGGLRAVQNVSLRVPRGLSGVGRSARDVWRGRGG
jgi:ABC-type branched-subunit amino acid transport system ATPase component